MQNNPSDKPDPRQTPPLLPPRPDLLDYLKAFDKPLTKDEKLAWIGEITYLVLHGILPREVYPALREKIESLPEAEPSKDRPEEKFPGQDYVHYGPPKPYVPTTTTFPDAKPMHAYETPANVRRREPNSPAFVLFLVGFVAIVSLLVYAMSRWATNDMENVAERELVHQVRDGLGENDVTEKESPLPARESADPFENADWAFDVFDEQESKRMGLGEQLFGLTEYKDGCVPNTHQLQWNAGGDNLSVPITNVDDHLVIDIQKKGTVEWIPQLFLLHAGLKKDRRYLFAFEMKANLPTIIAVEGKDTNMQKRFFVDAD